MNKIIFFSAFVLIGLNFCSASSYFNDQGNYLYLGNDYLEIILDKNWKGGIESVIDNETDEDYLSNSGTLRTLFLFGFYNSTYSGDNFFCWDNILITNHKQILL